MQRADQRRMEVNRWKWDESVPLHAASRDYDVPGFKRGANPLHPIELRELGSVRGRTLLHLQCHFGMDTLSWARRGARVTGVDYSAPAVAAARELALDIGIHARFVESNLYEATRRLRGRFDIVYTGKGALIWLPDLARWATTIAHFLKPGGRFFLMEDHPISDICDGSKGGRIELARPYFRHGPVRGEWAGTYAARKARMRHRVSFEWVHPISEVTGALLEAGLRIDSLVEYPFTYWHKFPAMKKDRDGSWHFSKREGSIPLMYSLRATKE
jgi:phthiocerol/phenolphthiocerol synthesis type-I polyketide synthase E